MPETDHLIFSEVTSKSYSDYILFDKKGNRVGSIIQINNNFNLLSKPSSIWTLNELEEIILFINKLNADKRIMKRR